VVRKFQRLAALSAEERRLLARALGVVASIRLALWLLPFQWTCRQVRKPGAASGRLATMPVSRFAWAVQTAARRVPAASCLTQALALQWLLVRAGRPASLRIGVAKDAARGLESHAWVECEGQVLPENDAAASRFATILALRAD
jgi:hypothetical protein